jgi:AcrR family transcriptional regulator
MTARKIIAAARLHFGRMGYDAVPLSEIAREAGIKTPSIYAHFKSKEELFLAAFDELLQEHMERTRGFKEQITGYSTEEKLFTILHEMYQTYLLDEDQMAFLKRAMLFPPAALEQELKRRFTAAEGPLSELLDGIFLEGIDNGLLRKERVADLTASFYCLLDGTFVQQFYYGKENGSQRLQTVWSIYWQGLLAKPKESI